MIKDILLAIKDDACREGTVLNCRWLYLPSNTDECKTLCLATRKNFDRWANSSILEINVILWDSGDPEFEKFLSSLIKLF